MILTINSSSPQIYLHSDSHYGHANIIKYCNRPFATVEEMDRAMVDNWNNVVEENDIVFHLGDFCSWNKKYNYVSLREQLNGKIILIKGNHDIENLKKQTFKNMFLEVYDYLDLEVFYKERKLKFALFHYPIESWWRNSIHLHGHIHSKNEKQLPGRIDVGADAWNYTPVSLDQILNFS